MIAISVNPPAAEITTSPSCATLSESYRQIHGYRALPYPSLVASHRDYIPHALNGPLLTERSRQTLAAHPEQYEGLMAQAETPEFNGRLIHALYEDPKLDELNGQTVIGAEIAERYGITEEGGRKPPSYRAMLGDPRIPHPAIVR